MLMNVYFTNDRSLHQICNSARQSIEKLRFTFRIAFFKGHNFISLMFREVSISLSSSLGGRHPCLPAATLKKEVQRVFALCLVNQQPNRKFFETLFVVNEIVYTFISNKFYRKMENKKVIKKNTENFRTIFEQFFFWSLQQFIWSFYNKTTFGQYYRRFFKE